MAITDTLAFLNTDEFGVTCQIGAGASFVGILDSPMEQLAGGMALTREYLLYAKTSDVGATSVALRLRLAVLLTRSGKTCQ